ncbi:MAG TPA: hypothetical protein PKC30_14375 [Saprospiraceae bacterium]|nr:hypothetical protein [Saprospiraceae bacterium]
MSNSVHFQLKQLENIFQELGYRIRYEKGHFQSGYCLIENRKMVVINKYFDRQGRIESLKEILKTLVIDFEQLTVKNIRNFERYLKTESKLQVLEA